MLKSCSYCGRIHDSKSDCGRKPKQVRKRYEKEVFRSSGEWQRKAEEIRQRDKYLCQICIRNIYNTKRIFNSDGLSVHHAIPLKERFDLRSENLNLITLCEMHHEMAEVGMIPLEVIKDIIRQQEGISPRGSDP